MALSFFGEYRGMETGFSHMLGEKYGVVVWGYLQQHLRIHLVLIVITTI